MLRVFSGVSQQLSSVQQCSQLNGSCALVEDADRGTLGLCDQSFGAQLAGIDVTTALGDRVEL